jgi:hypothetical protein
MDNVHGTHGTAGVVEDPLLIQVDVVGVQLRQLAGDLVHNLTRVVPVLLETAQDKIVQVVGLQEVEGLEVLLQDVEDRGQEAEEDGAPGQQTRRTARHHGCGDNNNGLWDRRGKGIWGGRAVRGMEGEGRAE